MLVIRTGIHKMLVRMAKREYTDQTAFCLGLFSSQLVFKIILELLLWSMKAGTDINRKLLFIPKLFVKFDVNSH